MIQRLFCLSAILSLALAPGTAGFAQDELPPVPSFTAPGSSDSVPPLPGLDASVPSQDSASVQTPASVMSNGNAVTPVVYSDPNFQANMRKPFVGQTHGAWPPSFSNSRAASSPVNPHPSSVASTAASELPPLPNSELETASVNPPVAQIPPIRVPDGNPVAPRQPIYTPQQPQYTPSVPSVPSNPYSQPAPAVPQNNPYSQPAPTVPQRPYSQPAPAVPQNNPYSQPAPAVPQNQPYSSPTIAPAQTPGPAPAMRPQPAPAQAQQPVYLFHGGSICPLNIRPSRPGENPMTPLLAWANEGLQTFNAKIKDYSCVMIKRERLDGQLQESSTIYMKIREEPFSIYVKYLKPDKKAGIEALYRKGYHNDQLLGHEVGFKAIAGSLWLDPNGRMAMAGQKYPITDGGIPNLVRKMLETVRLDIKNDPQGKETFVKFVENGGAIDGRPCIRIDVMHPVPRPFYRFHRAEIYIDKEWGVPVRYAAWMWPKEQGGKPVLDEEFTYTKLRFNCGFTDWDFNEKNKEYKF